MGGPGMRAGRGGHEGQGGRSGRARRQGEGRSDTHRPGHVWETAWTGALEPQEPLFPTMFWKGGSWGVGDSGAGDAAAWAGALEPQEPVLITTYWRRGKPVFMTSSMTFWL